MSKGTKIRTVRIEDELWEKAKVKAEEQGNNLSDILRKALRDYIESENKMTSIDESTREAMAKAWDEGYDEAEHEPIYQHAPKNPYRDH